MSDLDSICTGSMLDAAQLIQSRELSPVDLTAAMLSRIAEFDDKLHSYILVTEDLAMMQARSAEAEIQAGKYRGPMHGIPIGLKDLLYTKGITTTCASRILRDFVPSYNAAIVDKLNDAGTVTLGKLNLTEFALYGYHPDYTPPNNPWKLDHWAGVSSSGSGAATSGALCFASIGTDTGGSIRFPSSACGIVGIKATFGKVSRYGIFPLSDTMDHPGPMARTVADAAVMLSVIEGRDDRDAATRSDPKVDYLTLLDGDIRGLRIGIEREFCSTDTDPEQSAACFAALDHYQALGAKLVELNMPGLAKPAHSWMDTCAVDALMRHHDYYPSRAADYGPVYRALLEHGAKVTAEAYAQGLLDRQAVMASLENIFTHCDVMLCPATPTPAPPQSETPPQGVMAAEDAPGLVRFTAPFNYSGSPSVTLPNGFNSAGLPTSMQLIGRHGDEATIIRAAHAYEQSCEWHKFRPEFKP
ncbi:MAG: amidase [Gammaproteobacteria bacterium]